MRDDAALKMVILTLLATKIGPQKAELLYDIGKMLLDKQIDQNEAHKKIRQHGILDDIGPKQDQ